MKAFLWAAVACCFAIVGKAACCSAADMPQEEVVVRRVYAKTQCALQLKPLYEQAARRKAGLTPPAADSSSAEQLTFELSDFRIGALSEISATKYSDLVTKPSGADGLFVTPVVQNRREGDMGTNYTTDTAQAHWGKEQLLLEDWNLPMSEAAKVAEANTSSRLTRYASFAVTVKFQSRMRRYRALFLFGTNAKGEPFTLPVDTVVNVNGSALTWFLQRPIVPDVFLKTSLKDDPTVRGWFESHHQPSCEAAARDVCCDLVRMECGW